jgi:hypothetical protein
LITDGERRYGQVLFDLCSELIRTGKRGRPPKTLPKGIQVRVTTKHVPAVALGITEQGLSLAEIFSYPHAFGIKRNQCRSG